MREADRWRISARNPQQMRYVWAKMKTEWNISMLGSAHCTAGYLEYGFRFLAFLFARNKSIFYAKESQFFKNPLPKFFCRLFVPNAKDFDRAKKKLIHFSSESPYKFSIFCTLKCKIFSLQLIQPPKIIFDIKRWNIQRELNKCLTAVSADRCNAMQRIYLSIFAFHFIYKHQRRVSLNRSSKPIR